MNFGFSKRNASDKMSKIELNEEEIFQYRNTLMLLTRNCASFLHLDVDPVRVTYK